MIYEFYEAQIHMLGKAYINKLYSVTGLKRFACLKLELLIELFSHGLFS